ncbi:hypothetical protein SUGI_0970300 [Cryptomeria japonica]|uniref:structural maintenance of chromosomes protein 6B n=1 Tax=Cryptomeria japonica TaxID=3369 RepID=UPI0024149B67|nr:structural maintenance of chromosomes protein 6B [Cryptomeria japonica]GLJ46058.1 hypothetical protein SUGI_0970300 [Cryptomeria japonica]
MEDIPEEFPVSNSQRGGAGTILRIRVENFMCHSSLQIEFSEWVNFITGQNGSGKSAILTALCIAFGIKAKSTQRATSLKEFIKNGCSYALVVVELKNEGEDAFKHEVYGDKIIIERRILESSSTTTLKNYQGKRVTQKRDELHELVEHFNIDVENPCVIMTQDKSREFLHSGNDKEKFKFFFKATLLQQVHDLLKNIRNQLDASSAMIDELEASIRPSVKELEELEDKIKSMEYVEKMSQQVQPLKKKLAWSWVYEIDKQIQQQTVRLEKLKGRIPTVQARIDKKQMKIQEMEVVQQEKKATIASMMEKTKQLKKSQDELQQNLSQATRDRVELEEELDRRKAVIQRMHDRVRFLQQQIFDIQERHVRTTQAEKTERERRFKKVQEEVDEANLKIERLRNEEHLLNGRVASAMENVKTIASEVEENQSKYRDIKRHIETLRRQQSNKVTAFGGDRVLSLLRSIENRHRQFTKPPIGPIGAHVTLVKDQDWALAIEHAIGKLLNAFVVTNHKDALLLRSCARDANYSNLQIIIYDFNRPLLNIPDRMLPDKSLQTVMSTIHTEIPTIVNVLVDQGSMERQVLVRDYEMGKAVAFENRSPNVKEVFTMDGFKMFSRGSVQTTLPPDRRIRLGRLCAAIGEKIDEYENEASKIPELIRFSENKKSKAEKTLSDVRVDLQSTKRHLLELERFVTSKRLHLRDLKSSAEVEATGDYGPNVDELEQEITKVQSEIQQKEDSIEKLKIRMIQAQKKADDCKLSFDTLCDSARVDIEAFKEAERELLSAEDTLSTAAAEKTHYEGIMRDKVIPEAAEAEKELKDLQDKREENYKKASVICPEAEVEALGGCHEDTPEKLSAQLKRLTQRLNTENQRHPESIDDLRMKYAKHERKINKKRLTFDFFRNKLNACCEALELRQTKFERNASLLKRQLTWQFNGHLKKKGISGHIKVNYNEERLCVEVKMPQDNSSSAVRDTRGLSGGERSFSTLCFALALHEMTEAPFRAMDEFDVFMDAVSRKISLDTVVDFAKAQGSQWIFITPHDISMVKSDSKVKKQEMPAPRR